MARGCEVNSEGTDDHAQVRTPAIKSGIAMSLAALTSMGGVAWAAIQSTDGTIKGCYVRTAERLGCTGSRTGSTPLPRQGRAAESLPCHDPQ